ncbi:hypothetical protein SCLCIDRAFT_1221575 [Scleroderma citrinum Foug A]|uniref:Uncharacterized protein n=1 Tax=Scleroderma citrinum Foug A TaxID=1036808 RepID=A0A0C2YZF0_9AGAM|nr:hypothetical protein SCLCIDRAFT_1221575 [Scleroderma citrinum Foug A]
METNLAGLVDQTAQSCDARFALIVCSRMAASRLVWLPFPKEDPLNFVRSQQC